MTKRKNGAARALGKKRWAGVSKKARRAHAQMMVRMREAKKKGKRK